MKITATKIKRLLVKDYGWSEETIKQHEFYFLLIKDTLTIIDNELKYHENISIKKSKKLNYDNN